MKTRTVKVTYREFMDKYWPDWEKGYHDSTGVAYRVPGKPRALPFLPKNRDSFPTICTTKRISTFNNWGEETISREITILDREMFDKYIKPLYQQYEELTGEYFIILEKQKF